MVSAVCLGQSHGSYNISVSPQIQNVPSRSNLGQKAQYLRNMHLTGMLTLWWICGTAVNNCTWCKYW